MDVRDVIILLYVAGLLRDNFSTEWLLAEWDLRVPKDRRIRFPWK
jgi:hypothetical protein